MRTILALSSIVGTLLLGCSSTEVNNPAPVVVVVASPDAGGDGVGRVDGGADATTTPPPLISAQGTFVATCLTELANEQLTKVFTFWATTGFAPNVSGVGGDLTITLQPLALTSKSPPETISTSDFTGPALPPIKGQTDANGSFVATIESSQTATAPGASNPISGSDLLLTNENGALVGLEGRYSHDHYSARLTGHIKEPAAAERDLDPSANFCLFTPVKDGDPAPAHTVSDYTVANCPL
jgi:hypothetical protein